MSYVCIVSLFEFTCISTCALGILKTCFIDVPQIDKVTVSLLTGLYTSSLTLFSTFIHLLLTVSITFSVLVHHACYIYIVMKTPTVIIPAATCTIGIICKHWLAGKKWVCGVREMRVTDDQLLHTTHTTSGGAVTAVLAK